MNLIVLKCPSCNGYTEVSDDEKYFTCQYCGTKTLISDENNKTIHTVDEARLREVKLKEQMYQHNLELEEQEKLRIQSEQEKEKKKKKKKIIIAAAFLAILLAVEIIGFVADSMIIQLCTYIPVFPLTIIALIIFILQTLGVDVNKKI